jgi:hypothetical protein
MFHGARDEFWFLIMAASRGCEHARHANSEDGTAQHEIQVAHHEPHRLRFGEDGTARADNRRVTIRNDSWRTGRFFCLLTTVASRGCGRARHAHIDGGTMQHEIQVAQNGPHRLRFDEKRIKRVDSREWSIEVRS